MYIHNLPLISEIKMASLPLTVMVPVVIEVVSPFTLVLSTVIV